MKSKKGVVEVQFNWIFVLIAGGFILGFFAFVAIKQKVASEEQADVLVAQMLDSVLASAKISADTQKTITLPKADVKFDCTGYTIRGKRSQLQYLNFFSPGLISGKELFFKTKEWKVPFRVGNLMYVTSPQVRYIFVGKNTDDMALVQGVYDELISGFRPEGASDEVYWFDDTNDLLKSWSDSGWTGPVSVQDKNNYKVRFVVFGAESDIDKLLPANGDALTDIKKTAWSDISAVVVKRGTSGDYQLGEVEYYRSNEGKTVFEALGTDNSVSYYKNATMFGAIFAESPTMYECVVGKELEKLNRIAEILYERAGDIADEYTSGGCGDLYDLGSNNDVDKAVDALSELSSYDFTTNIDDWPSYIDDASADARAFKLRRANNELESWSCALLY